VKNAVAWGVTSCDSCKNQCFGKRITSILRVTRIGELGTTLAVTSNRSTLWRNTILCYITLCYKKTTQGHKYLHTEFLHPVNEIWVLLGRSEQGISYQGSCFVSHTKNIYNVYNEKYIQFYWGKVLVGAKYCVITLERLIRCFIATPWLARC
jgi:hypothetical protein